MPSSSSLVITYDAIKITWRDQIRRIAIAKCDLHSHYCDFKEMSFYYLCDTKFCAKHEEKTREFHLYCLDHVCKANEWCLVGCFYREIRVSTQIMVCDYCIAKRKVFRLRRTCNDPSGHFFFAIQNIYINSNLHRGSHLISRVANKFVTDWK